MNFFTQLFKRWNADSPAFFVTIQNISLTLISVAGLILGIPAAINSATTLSIDLGFLTTISQYILAAATVMGLIAKTGVKNPEEIK